MDVSYIALFINAKNIKDIGRTYDDVDLIPTSTSRRIKLDDVLVVQTIRFPDPFNPQFAVEKVTAWITSTDEMGKVFLVVKDGTDTENYATITLR